jgi:hypothetical protein
MKLFGRVVCFFRGCPMRLEYAKDLWGADGESGREYSWVCDRCGWRERLVAEHY